MAQRIIGFLQTRKQYMQFSSLIAISVILLLAIIVFLNNSLGWFASGNAVTASNMTITAADDSDFSVLGFTVYKNKYDRATLKNEFYTGTDATLNEYDTVFTSRNEENAVIIKIEVKGLSVGDKFRLKFNCTDATAELNYISDMVKFRAASLNLIGTDEEIYKSAVTELENGENKDYLFITEQNGSITEKQTAFETDSLTMTEGGAIYILIDYYPNVIQSKDIAFDGENETTQYEGDISSIEVIKE